MPRFSAVTLSSNLGGVSVPGKPPPALRETHFKFGSRERGINLTRAVHLLYGHNHKSCIHCKAVVSETADQ
jgi:hypothetical protein